MIDQYFLWPVNKVGRALASALQLIPIKRVELKLQEMFPSGYPVLCSSGRAALYFALEESNVKRRDMVGIFPYASHCVIDAVARIGTPLPGPNAVDSNMRIVYHQWGFVQETILPSNTIEDCVDTLCIKGTPLFPGGGNFEIWSLPKIAGTTSGGVLWCRNEETAIRIRHLRDKRGNGLGQWLIRLLMKGFPSLYNYWQGAEAVSGNVSRLQTGDIMSALNNWDILVEDRLEKMNIAWPITADWLVKPQNRLPTVLPVMPNQNISEADLFELGLTGGFRMMEKLHTNGERIMIKVVPLPIHYDVRKERLCELVDFFNIYENSKSE